MTRALNHQLLEPYAVIVVPARHIREDDLIAFLQSTENFHGVYRATSELYLDTICILGVRLELKHTDRALFLTECGAANIQHIGQALKVDRAIDAQVRTHAGSRALELYVNCNGPILHRWINAHHLAVNHAVVCIDGSRQANGDVLGLGLGNLQLGLELLRLYDLRQQSASGNILTSLQRRFLKHALFSGANLE